MCYAGFARVSDTRLQVWRRDCVSSIRHFQPILDLGSNNEDVVSAKSDFFMQINIIVHIQTTLYIPKYADVRLLEKIYRQLLRFRVGSPRL